MLRYLLISLFVFFVLVSSSRSVFAQSSHVLPYPSFMPGSKLYVFSEIKDMISQIFYFGDFGRFKYNLSQSDKYLVEAKTLFEYNQFLLARDSLEKSNSHFLKIGPSLINASKNNKAISEKQNILDSASLKHIEVLEKLKAELPPKFDWNPEKDQAQTIEIRKLLENSIKIRTSYD